MKPFSNSGNAGRAAKKALGQHAKPKVDFVTKKVEGGYVWEALGQKQSAEAPKHEPAPKRPKRVKGEAKLEDQPQMRRMIEMCARKTGATIEEIATRLECEQHTVRGALSRLRSESKIDFLDARIGRKKTFFTGEHAEENKTAAVGEPKSE